MQDAYTITNFTYETIVFTPRAALSGSCQDVAQHDRRTLEGNGGMFSQRCSTRRGKRGARKQDGSAANRRQKARALSRRMARPGTAVQTGSIADEHRSSFVAPNSYASPGKGSAETLQGKQQLTHTMTETHCNDLQVQRGKLTTYSPILKYMHFIWACQ